MFFIVVAQYLMCDMCAYTDWQMERNPGADFTGNSIERCIGCTAILATMPFRAICLFFCEHGGSDKIAVALVGSHEIS